MTGGWACLLAAVISILAMFSMMGGRNAGFMAQYQAALDRMSKAGTEYVRGIPVVKIFQQTVYSFRAFQQSIEDYSRFAGHYNAEVCSKPQSVNLTFTEGAFVFLVPAALFLAPGALAGGDFAGFVTNFAFYAVFSAILSTALARIMFASSGMMLASGALARIQTVTGAPTLEAPACPKLPQGNRVAFRDVSFTYGRAGADGGAGGAVGRRQDDGRQPHPPLLGRRRGRGGSRRGGRAGNRPPRPDGPGGLRVPEQPPVQAEPAGEHPGRASAGHPPAGAGRGRGGPVRRGTEGVYLSGGEAQRIALARAILKDAPIVVLDEATAFADPENEALIQKALARLTAGMDEGRAVEQGAHAELLAKGGLYAKMWADYNQSVRWKIQSGEER